MAEAPRRIEIPLTVEHDGETVEIGRLCYVREDVAERENAELRELVRDLLHHIEYPPCEGCLLEMSCAGDLSQCDEYFDWLKPRARKLGVEVEP